jgi:hypothetical protein
MDNRTHEMRFDYIIKQAEGPSIGVEVTLHDQITDEVDRAFREKLWATQLLHGILFSRQRMRVYHDFVSSSDPETFGFREADTSDVLRVVVRDNSALANPDLYPTLVRQWIGLLADNWSRAIPPELAETLVGLVSAAAEGELVADTDLEVVPR